MHLTENCTGLSETAMKRVLAPGKNALLLRNACVEDKRQEKFADALQEHATVKEHQENQMKYLECEMTDLKKAVSEIKSFITSKPPIEAVPTVVPTPKPEAPPKPVEEIDGIRIRGIPESNEKEARLRQEHDLAHVQKLLAHVEVNADIVEVIRLGRHEK